MKRRAFQKLLSQIEKLTISQEKQLQNQLNKQNSLKTIKSITIEVDHCPHCGATNLYKWGVRSRLQRYKCKECNKTFNALSKTPLARLRHKERWSDYAKGLLESYSIEKSAKQCNVAISTSFRWRHRMLKVSQEIKAKKLHGIVELDETYFPRSEKGNHSLDRKPHKRGSWAKRGLSLKEHVPVLIARDRNGNTTDAVLENGQDGSIAEVMLPLLDRRDVLLCSDSKSSYKSFARLFDFVHETINASKEYVNGIYHVQNVNAYGSRLKNWMVHFHGVSTKYLDNYLGWMRILDTQKELTPDGLLRLVINCREKNYGLPPLMRI
jgi:transposase-like protein